MADIVDTCPGCNDGCLDMSTSCKYINLYIDIILIYHVVFEAVCGGLELGICKIKWAFA